MLSVYGLTDKGLVRNQNEDMIYLTDNENMNLYIIADGMGGANAGEVASNKAIEFVVEYIKQNYTEESNQEIKELIKKAIQYSNEKVYELSVENIEYKGMGTTIIVLIIVKNRMFIGHLGDSSLYRKRKNIIRKITKDHTYVQQLIDDKTITKQEAKTHPKRHMITKVLGCDLIVDPDIMEKKLELEDYVILCTDGVTNLVKDKEILNIIDENIEPQKICEELINIANQRGGYDNISVIALKYE